ncbi:hypothetical protein MAP00_007922 [Monascus purpureus]|nr:hypothetical protein MAP00_007922 [Monascus purpureus]
MLCFTKSWKASSSASGGAQSPAHQAISEIISKYHNVRPMSPSNSGQMEDTVPSKPSFADEIYDIFLRDYCGIEIIGGQYRMVFTARFKECPDKIRLISCPQFIRAPNLTPARRELLRIKLDAVLDRISNEEWDKLKDRFNIVKNEWCIVSDEQEEQEI